MCLIKLCQIIALSMSVICATAGLSKTSKETEIVKTNLLTKKSGIIQDESLEEFTSSTKEKHHSRMKRESNDSSGQDITSLLDSMLHEDKYDPRIRPNIDGDPVIVQVGLWVIAIDSINVMEMDYKMDFYLRQLWYDPRLAHNSNTTFTISNKILDKIWLPDTYFVNLKHSKFHHVTTQNMLLAIGPDGLVHFNARVTVKPACPMDLRMFPNDEQRCNLDIESYSYSDKDIILVWENRSDGGMAIPPKIRNLPQHNITNIGTPTLYGVYAAGNWSGIRAVVTMKRKMGYFIIQVYSPCALIVVLSWISFCIPLESTAARVTLGITSVLTTTTILNILNNSMPKVSYLKAIDWYLICCFLFVFGVLVEYTVVLYIENYRQRKLRKRELQEKIEKAEKEGSKRPFKEGTEKRHQTFARVRAKNVHIHLENEEKTKKNIFHKLKKYILNLRGSEIDELARICFPILFMNFNLVYWLIFLSY